MGCWVVLMGGVMTAMAAGFLAFILGAAGIGLVLLILGITLLIFWRVRAKKQKAAGTYVHKRWKTVVPVILIVLGILCFIPIGWIIAVYLSA